MAATSSDVEGFIKVWPFIYFLEIRKKGLRTTVTPALMIEKDLFLTEKRMGKIKILSFPFDKWKINLIFF